MPVTNNVPERKSALSKIFNFNTLNATVMGGLGGAFVGYHVPLWAFQLGALALTGGFAAVPAALAYGATASAVVLGGLTGYWNMKAVGNQSTFDNKKQLHRRNNTLIAISTIGGLAAGITLSGGLSAGITALGSASHWLAFVGAGVQNVGSTLIPALGMAYGAVANYTSLNWDVKDALAEEMPKKPASAAPKP